MGASEPALRPGSSLLSLRALRGEDCLDFHQQDDAGDAHGRLFDISEKARSPNALHDAPFLPNTRDGEVATSELLRRPAIRADQVFRRCTIPPRRASYAGRIPRAAPGGWGAISARPRTRRRPVSSPTTLAAK